jgi:MFS family permease
VTAASADEATPPDGWRTFLILWVTQSVSLMGSALTQFAMIIWLTTSRYPGVEQKQALAWALSALTLSFAIPTVFAAPISGAFVDRHDRRRTMMISDVLSGLLGLVTIAVLSSGRLNLAGLVAIGASAALIGSFHAAAFDTSYAMLVPAEKLPRANGMMQTIWALSGVVTPGVAATLIALPALARRGALPHGLAFLGRFREGAVLAIGVDAVTFFLSAAVLVFLAVPSPRRTDLADAEGRRKSLWADVREGARFIWHRPPFLWLLGTFALANVGSGTQVLVPLLLKFRLAPDWSARGFSFETALALVSTSASLGGVGGGLIVSAWGGLRRRRIYGVVVPILLLGLVQIVFGFSRLIFLSAATAAVAASLPPFLNAHSQAIWQSQTPREIQGRVFSVRRLIAQFSWPMSAFMMGALASRFDPAIIMAICGAVLALWCVLALFNPYLRRVEDREWLEAEAARRMGRAAGGPPAPAAAP